MYWEIKLHESKALQIPAKLFTSRCRNSNAESSSLADTEATNMKPFSFSTDFSSSTMSTKLDRRRCDLREEIGSSEAATFLPRDSSNDRNRTSLILENISNTFHAASSILYIAIGKYICCKIDAQSQHFFHTVRLVHTRKIIFLKFEFDN